MFSRLLFQLLTLLFVFPCLLIAWFFLWRARRDWKRWHDGWWVDYENVGYNGGFLGECEIRYHKPEVKLYFVGDCFRKGTRGRMVVFVPNEESWRESAPVWATEQREEIIARLEQHFDCEVDEKERFWNG